MARLAFLAAVALALGVSAAEQQPAAPPSAAPVNASAKQPQLRGGAGHGVAAAAATPAPTPAPDAAGAAGHAERAAQVLAAARAGVAKANATAPVGGQVEAEWFDWGHGHQGETCCMCSYQYGGPTGTVVIYAAEDYDNGNFWGSHGAFWHCERECERKCDLHSGGHKFGCLDEQHLRSLSTVLRRAPGFEIEHQRRFGNLC